MSDGGASSLGAAADPLVASLGQHRRQVLSVASAVIGQLPYRGGVVLQARLDYRARSPACQRGLARRCLLAVSIRPRRFGRRRRGWRGGRPGDSELHSLFAGESYQEPASFCRKIKPALLSGDVCQADVGLRRVRISTRKCAVAGRPSGDGSQTIRSRGRQTTRPCHSTHYLQSPLRVNAAQKKGGSGPPSSFGSVRPRSPSHFAIIHRWASCNALALPSGSWSHSRL